MRAMRQHSSRSGAANAQGSSTNRIMIMGSKHRGVSTCALSHRVMGGKVYIDPIQLEASAFAPATIANLGPGFDWLGCAVEGEGDIVTARALPDRPGQIVIERIDGDNGRLSLDPAKNCVGIAAAEALKQLGQPSCGVALTLQKGLPLGSGLGSSAASAAAAAWAVNGLFGCPLSKDALVAAGVVSEAAVSGYHADNVGPALMGGFVLVRSMDPLQLVRLPFGGMASSSSSSSSSSDSESEGSSSGPDCQPLWFVLVNPVFEAPTAKMRAALPPTVPFKSMVHNCTQGGALVAAILSGDVPLLGAALDSDCVVEPVRAPLIPGMLAVKEAAKAAGAYGCTISGAGPTAVAVVSDPVVGGRVAEAMARAFKDAGGLDTNNSVVVQLDRVGARLLV